MTSSSTNLVVASRSTRSRRVGAAAREPRRGLPAPRPWGQRRPRILLLPHATHHVPRKALMIWRPPSLFRLLAWRAWSQEIQRWRWIGCSPMAFPVNCGAGLSALMGRPKMLTRPLCWALLPFHQCIMSLLMIPFCPRLEFHRRPLCPRLEFHRCPMSLTIVTNLGD